MIGKVTRDQNNCLIPEQLAGPDDGSVMLVHHDTNCEYQLATAVDCFTSRAYLGITCCCKPLYNPSTGALKVDCLCGTATNVDINTNSDSNCNVPILVQGTKTVSGATSLTDTIEKSVAVYNDNCYICNDPVTGCPVCKPVVYIPTVKADEFIGVPASGIQYVNSLPNNPEDTTYGTQETVSINMTLKQFVDKYMMSNGLYFIPKDNLISTSLELEGSYYGIDITNVSLDYELVNTYISTDKYHTVSGTATVLKFYFGQASNDTYHEVGTGDGSGSVEVECCACSTGKPLAYNSNGELVTPSNNVYFNWGVCSAKLGVCINYPGGISRDHNLCFNELGTRLSNKITNHSYNICLENCLTMSSYDCPFFIAKDDYCTQVLSCDAKLSLDGACSCTNLTNGYFNIGQDTSIHFDCVNTTTGCCHAMVMLNDTSKRLLATCDNTSKCYLIEGEAGPTAFIGLRCEWDALTSTEQNQYAIVNITDENVAPIAVSNCVQSGDQNPVTSDAVAQKYRFMAAATSQTLTRVPSAGDTFIFLLGENYYGFAAYTASQWYTNVTAGTATITTNGNSVTVTTTGSKSLMAIIAQGKVE